jgi:hypothetical protein
MMQHRSNSMLSSNEKTAESLEVPITRADMPKAGGDNRYNSDTEQIVDTYIPANVMDAYLDKLKKCVSKALG